MKLFGLFAEILAGLGMMNLGPTLMMTHQVDGRITYRPIQKQLLIAILDGFTSGPSIYSVDTLWPKDHMHSIHLKPVTPYNSLHRPSPQRLRSA